MKSLAHPEWPYTGTPWEWRGFAEMLSLSHWGMHPAPQAKYTRAWYNEQRHPPANFYYDAEYIHNTFQKLNFGPELT